MARIARTAQFAESGHAMNDAIILMHPLKDSRCPQEYAFLRQLGYAVSTRLTQEKYSVTQSFKRILKNIFPDRLSFITKVASDIFIDCFVLAAAVGTSLEEGANFIYVEKDEKQKIVQYFSELFYNFDDYLDQ